MDGSHLALDRSHSPGVKHKFSYLVGDSSSYEDACDRHSYEYYLAGVKTKPEKNEFRLVRKSSP